MTDFTLKKYNELLDALKQFGFVFINYKDLPKSVSNQKLIILRHDVDDCKQNSLEFAKIQHAKGITGTYYFRTIPQSYDEKIILEMAGMGHEIGYHYETMDTCRGNVEKAYDEFCRNLEMFRKIVSVTTICMHGSPLSKFDNRDIWKKYDYKKLGLTAEPYFDLDFNSVFYITDTGRRWDGDKVSIRDKAKADNPVTNPLFLNLRLHATSDIINALQKKSFPEKVMMTFHPQRWTDNPLQWSKELVLQNTKNAVKYFLVRNQSS